MWLLLLARDAAVLLGVFCLPGYLLTRAAVREVSRVEALALAVAGGTVSVSILSFTYALALQVFLTPAIIIVSSILVSAASLAFLRLRAGGRKAFVKDLVTFAPGNKGGWAAVVLSLFVFSFFMINKDRTHFYYDCVNQVVLYAIDPKAMLEGDLRTILDGRCDEGEHLSGSDDHQEPYEIICAGKDGPRQTQDLIKRRTTGQRYGTTALLAPFAVLYKAFGFRLYFGLLGFFITIFSFLTVEKLVSSRAIALAAAAFAALNPYMIKVITLDENVMACAMAIAGIYLLLRRPASLWLTGLMIGAAAGIRHFNVALLLGAALFLWTASEDTFSVRARRIVRPGTGFLLATLPCILHHLVAYGSIFTHEHFIDEVYFFTPHRFLFWDFLYGGLLNFPFYDHIIRTPYNPFPTFLYYPLSVVSHFGLLACALIVLGLVWALRNHTRFMGSLLALWALPVWLLLSVLEDSADPNKMGIAITTFPLLVLLFGAGLRAVFSRSRLKAGGALLIVCALLFGLVRGASRISVPADPRFFVKYEEVRRENPAYLRFERASITKANFLPDLSMVEHYTEFDPLRRLMGLKHAFLDRAFLLDREWLPGDFGTSARTALLTLDLSRPLIGRSDFLTISEHRRDEAPPVDLTLPNAEYAVQDLEVPWADRPMDALFYTRHGKLAKIFLRFGKMHLDYIDLDYSRFGPIVISHPNVVKIPTASSLISFRVNATTRLKIIEVVDIDESLFYCWDVVLRDGELRVSRAHRIFHN